MRTLSATIYKHEITGSNRNAGPDIIYAINDLQSVVEDIPGAGYMLNKVFPGGDITTKYIEVQLTAIKRELDQMHSELRQEYEDTMTAFE